MTWIGSNSKDWWIMWILNEWRNELVGTIKWWSNAQPLTALAAKKEEADAKKWQNDIKDVAKNGHNGEEISEYLVDWEMKRIDKRKHD